MRMNNLAIIQRLSGVLNTYYTNLICSPCLLGMYSLSVRQYFASALQVAGLGGDNRQVAVSALLHCTHERDEPSKHKVI